jgi:UDP-glucose 4-epimerase
MTKQNNTNKQNDYAMQNILVTGGAGFIGSHLVKVLVKQGHNVSIIDNLSRGNRQNIGELIQSVEFIESDIQDQKILEYCIKKADMVFHLSALSRVIPCINDPESCFRNNIYGTELVARYCTKYTKKMIFSSSREVYGNSVTVPVHETSPMNPENPYGASKIAGEAIIKAFSKTFGLNYVILRLANVYGSNDFERVIPVFIQKAMADQDIQIFGGGQEIDFIFIDDVIDAFVKTLNPDTKDKICNIGSGTGTDLKTLAEMIIKKVSSNSKIVYKDLRKGEVEHYIADISYAKKLISWEPKFSLDSGLEKVITQY